MYITDNNPTSDNREDDARSDTSSNRSHPVVEYKGCPVVTNDLYNQREDMTFTGLRGYKFAEIFLTCNKTSPCYNTAGLNIMDDPKDSVPDSLPANFSIEAVATQYQVPSAYLNGPKIWMLDDMVIPTGVQVRDFDGIKARWMAYSERSPRTCDETTRIRTVHD